MEYRAIGPLTVSRVGYGCYGVGLGTSDNSPEDWIRLIRRAHDRGVTFFDTADRYGPAEEVLGRAVEPFRAAVVIATKVGLTADGGRDASPARIRQACATSLRRLGTDWIDLYQIHFDDPVTPVADTVAALEELLAQGKIRTYGVGHLPPARVEEYARLGRPVSCLYELSPVARLARRDLVPLCQRHGLAGVAFSPTGRGLLTGAAGQTRRTAPGDIRALDPLFQREKLASGLRVRDRLAVIGCCLGRTAAQVAIAWTLAQPGTAAVLTGPSRADHLEENLGGVGWTLPPQILADLEEFLAAQDVYLRDEAVRAVRQILASPLPRERDAAFRDLVYALEAAVEYGLVAEATVLPLAVELFGIRRQTGGNYHPSLEDLRARMWAVAGGGDPSGGEAGSGG